MIHFKIFAKSLVLLNVLPALMMFGSPSQDSIIARGEGGRGGGGGHEMREGGDMRQGGEMRNADRGGENMDHRNFNNEEHRNFNNDVNRNWSDNGQHHWNNENNYGQDARAYDRGFDRGANENVGGFYEGGGAVIFQPQSDYDNDDNSSNIQLDDSIPNGSL